MSTLSVLDDAIKAPKVIKKLKSLRDIQAAKALKTKPNPPPKPKEAAPPISYYPDQGRVDQARTFLQSQAERDFEANTRLATDIIGHKEHEAYVTADQLRSLITTYNTEDGASLDDIPDLGALMEAREDVPIFSQVPTIRGKNIGGQLVVDSLEMNPEDRALFLNMLENGDSLIPLAVDVGYLTPDKELPTWLSTGDGRTQKIQFASKHTNPRSTGYYQENEVPFYEDGRYSQLYHGNATSPLNDHERAKALYNPQLLGVSRSLRDRVNTAGEMPTNKIWEEKYQDVVATGEFSEEDLKASDIATEYLVEEMNANLQFWSWVAKEDPKGAAEWLRIGGEESVFNLSLLPGSEKYPKIKNYPIVVFHWTDSVGRIGDPETTLNFTKPLELGQHLGGQKVLDHFTKDGYTIRIANAQERIAKQIGRKFANVVGKKNKAFRKEFEAWYAKNFPDPHDVEETEAELYKVWKTTGEQKGKQIRELTTMLEKHRVNPDAIIGTKDEDVRTLINMMHQPNEGQITARVLRVKNPVYLLDSGKWTPWRLARDLRSMPEFQDFETKAKLTRIMKDTADGSVHESKAGTEVTEELWDIIASKGFDRVIAYANTHEPTVRTNAGLIRANSATPSFIMDNRYAEEYAPTIRRKSYGKSLRQSKYIPAAIGSAFMEEEEGEVRPTETTE